MNLAIVEDVVISLGFHEDRSLRFVQVRDEGYFSIVEDVRGALLQLFAPQSARVLRFQGLHGERSGLLQMTVLYEARGRLLSSSNLS